MAKTVGVDKSSIKDACRVVVANLEFCLSSTGYDPDSCKPEVASVERCCRRFWVRGLAAKRARQRAECRCFALVERAYGCRLAQQVTASRVSGAPRPAFAKRPLAAPSRSCHSAQRSITSYAQLC
jgi:hypothetical protein